MFDSLKYIGLFLKGVAIEQRVKKLEKKNNKSTKEIEELKRLKQWLSDHCNDF